MGKMATCAEKKKDVEIAWIMELISVSYGPETKVYLGVKDGLRRLPLVILGQLHAMLLTSVRHPGKE